MHLQPNKHLLVIDIQSSGELINSSLQTSIKCEVTIANTLQSAERLCADKSFDLIISEIKIGNDITLPFLTSLRDKNRYRKTPIIIITKHSSLTNRIAVLEAGLSDFIAKPFHPKELVARVKKELGVIGEECIMSNNDSLIELDQFKREVIINQVKVKLTISEFQILYCLLKMDSFCDHNALQKYLSTHKGKDHNSNALRVSIKRLRDKLEKITGMKVIKNRHGQGYYLAL